MLVAVAIAGMSYRCAQQMTELALNGPRFQELTGMRSPALSTVPVEMIWRILRSPAGSTFTTYSLRCISFPSLDGEEDQPTASQLPGNRRVEPRDFIPTIRRRVADERYLHALAWQRSQQTVQRKLHDLLGA